MITGTHGGPDGESGLSEKKSLEQNFYNEDCLSVGVKAGPKIKLANLSLSSWDGVPDITKPAEKLDPMPNDCYYKDEQLKEMDIRLANMSYYHDNGDKLVNDINEESFIKLLYDGWLIVMFYIYVDF